MLSKLKYACIGAGGIADKKHLNEYSKIDCVEVSAICDTNTATAEKLANKYGVPKVYSDYNIMFDELELDFVSICTPNYLHTPMTLAAIDRGIHVHCEKPLALNAIEAQEIVAAKNAKNVKVMVSMNNRFTRESLFISKYANEGYLGEIYHAKCGWRRRNGIPGKGVWFTDKLLSGGGSLIDLGVHFIDLSMFFMGYPKLSSVSGSSYCKFGNCDNRLRPGYKNNGDGKFDVEDMTVGLVRMENGATIDFEFSWASNIEKEIKYVELLGTKGGVFLNNGELKIYSEILGTSVNIEPEFNAASPYINEFKHFTDCIINHLEPLAPPEQAVQLMRIIDALYLSSDNNAEVRL